MGQQPRGSLEAPSNTFTPVTSIYLEISAQANNTGIFYHQWQAELKNTSSKEQKTYPMVCSWICSFLFYRWSLRFSKENNNLGFHFLLSNWLGSSQWVVNNWTVYHFYSIFWFYYLYYHNDSFLPLLSYLAGFLSTHEFSQFFPFPISLAVREQLCRAELHLRLNHDIHVVDKKNQYFKIVCEILLRSFILPKINGRVEGWAWSNHHFQYKKYVKNYWPSFLNTLVHICDALHVTTALNPLQPLFLVPPHAMSSAVLMEIPVTHLL